MARLRNPKWEKFAQAYVRGETAGDRVGSYKAAGYKGDHRDVHKVLNKPEVAARIAELQEQLDAIERQAHERAIEKLAISKESVIAELAKIGFANMLDYVQPAADGSVVVDLSALTRDQAAAISEVTVDTYTDGKGGDEEKREVKRIRFKLGDKRAALVDIGKHLGMFVERRHVTVEHADKSDAELRNEIAALAGELKQLGVDLGQAPANPVAQGGVGTSKTTH